jgi:PAS domain S-box-containing protein
VTRSDDATGHSRADATGHSRLAAQVVADVVDPLGPLPRSGYTRVLHDVPAAVLLVDVRRRQVVHANPAARRLTGDLRLPASAARWVEAAGLGAPGGTAYDPGDSPVDRATSGEPVFGEPVAVCGGQERRTLWVTGFPLPEPQDTDLALLVLFDVETDLPEARIRDRAVVAAGLSFTISDPRQPGHPLVYVNPAFERTTGYSYDETVGRNCRFLQGPDTDPAAVRRIRTAIEQEQHVVVPLLNYRKDGTAFWNELSLSPVHDGEGALTHFVGIQADVTARVHVEQERGRTLAAEQAARAAAEKAQRRLALLAEATSVLAATLDVEQSLARLSELVVPLMADFCFVELVSDDDVRRVACAHRDPAKLPLLQRAQELQPDARTEASPVRQVLETGSSILLRRVSDELIDDVDAGFALSQTYRELGLRSAIVVPLRARRQVLGALTLVSAESGRDYDEDDLSMAADLARRAALTVDNARLYQREHDVAEALQRSLLPQLPAVPGLDRAARYLPGSTAAQVGGDWYDLFALPDGAVGFAVGDVMGHDLTAAAAMGQLRSVLRSYAWQGSSPALVLDHLDQLVQGLGMAQLATAIYGRITLPTPAAPGALCLANAGHLPPVLRAPDGTTRLLTGAQSLLVGAALGTDRAELSEELPPGSLLVLYTDGLVERRGLDPDVGLERLRRAVEAADGADADTICDGLLAALDGTARDDDVALLVVRIL